MSKRLSPELRTVRIKESTRWDIVPSGSDYTETYTNELAYSRTYSGGVTPGFKNVKILPFNAYNLVVERWSPTYVTQQRVFGYKETAHWSVAGKSFSAEVQRYWAVGQDFSSVQGHNPDAEAVCSKKLQKHFNTISFHAGVFFGERQQTINLVANTAKRIVHAVRDLKRFRLGGAMLALGIYTPPKGGKDAFWARHGGRFGSDGKPRRNMDEKDLATAWLELQYGWKPLLSDVYGAATLLSDRIRKDEFSSYVKSSASLTESWPSNYYNYRTFAPSSSVSCGKSYKKTTCKYYAKFKTSSEMQSALASTGLTNPLSIAWELVPFSFVIDWFLPVGNFIEQLSVYNGFEFVSINRVQFTRGSVVVKGTIPGYYNEDSTSWLRLLDGYVIGTYSCMKYDRSTIAAPAFVPLEFKSPVSTTHAANALALVTTLFGSRKP